MSTTPQVDLVGVGLNATDTLIPLPHFPVCGSKTEYLHETVMPGGQTASAVIACQTWGVSTRYVGKLGDDDASRLHASEFARAGTDARLIHVPHAASPRSLILIDPHGERTVLCRRDDRLILQPHELQRDWITSARVLHIDGYDTAAATLAATWARQANIPVTADLDELYPGVDQLLPLIDYLIVSRDFPSRLTGIPDLPSALRDMHARYGARLTAATLGPEGVLAFDGTSFHFSPAYNVPVTDTTGAGDIFHAAFIYGLLQAWPLARQLDFACAAAALNCIFEGARGGIRPVADIDHLIATTPTHPRPTNIPT
jgi:sugar/nucleoside kinase (ribokinase family)